MLNALETGKRNLICSNKQIIIQPTTAILRPFTFVKSDLSQNKRFSALLNNQLNIYLSSTYKCNFLGADNKQ